MAVLGQQGIVQGTNYRGVSVIADVRAVPDSPWFMVASMDAAEVYAPVRQMLWLIIALVGALVIGAGGGVGLVWRQQSLRFYREKAGIAGALKTSEIQYRRLFEAARDGILILDADTGQVVDVNPFLIEMLGFSHKEFLAKKIWELGFLKDVIANKNAFAELQRKGYVRYEGLPMETAAGQQLEVEFVSNVYEVDHQKVIQCNIRDITERKQAEKQLMITDRLVSIGELASGIAHEINNPLTGIIGLSELVMDADVPAEVKSDLKMIHREARRAATIVQGLLTFARKHPQEKQPVDINNAIAQVMQLRAYDQKINNINVVTRFAPELPDIVADVFQLQQVFINIITNSEYFMTAEHGRGTLTISTERVDGIVRISFADDGPGIMRKNLEHVFDLFFTTKEVGKGTGLGLSICHGIIAAHGGRIYAESKLGRGATFIVELPVIAADNKGDNSEPD
jgi:PAS domain S-box-containing protein